MFASYHTDMFIYCSMCVQRLMLDLYCHFFVCGKARYMKKELGDKG